MATFQIQAVTVKEPASGRSLGLKLETARISCIQEQVKIQRFCQNIYRSIPFLLIDRASRFFHNESVFCAFSLSNEYTVHKHTSV
jgi:hypothetical protein